MPDRTTPWLPWLFAAAALAYLALLHLPASAPTVLLKVVPIACLCYAVLRGRGRHYRVVAAALLFCAAGDIGLALGHFLPGLGAFLLGHLCYLAAFASPPRWSGARLAVLCVIGAGAVGLLSYLVPRLGDMTLPVCAYVLVILAMSTAAVVGRDNHWLVALGALLFLVSDSLIALNRFGEPLDAAAYWIMTTYYGAQWLLTHDARGHDPAPATAAMAAAR